MLLSLPMDMFYYIKAADPIRRNSLPLTTKSPGVPGAQLIDLRSKKDWVKLGVMLWFQAWNPWIGNQIPYPLVPTRVYNAFSLTGTKMVKPSKSSGIYIYVGMMQG